MTNLSKKNTLVIVGSGIKFMAHLTTEVKACILQANKVLYLVNEPAIEKWIQKETANSESLEPLYTKFSARIENYQLIAEYICEQLAHYELLCVVMYGHPTVFVQPSLFAAKIATEQGYNVVIMPGISAEACLFADLVIDPGSFGCQSYEATDFLIHCREYDSRSHLILWQPFMIGVLGLPDKHNPRDGLILLVEYLENKYAADHEITLYEAAQYPFFRPKINKVTLKGLPEAPLSRLTTLYVPPCEQCLPDVNMVRKMKLLWEINE